MARQAVAVQNRPIGGLTNPTANAAHADGHAVPNNNGKTVIVVTNGNGASAVTVSVVPTDDRLGLSRETLDFEIADGAELVLPPLEPDVFEHSSGDDQGKVYLDFGVADTLTSVTIKAFLGT